MGYREEARNVHKETRWTIFKFLPIFIILVVILSVTGFVTRSLGLWGGTIVERKVFEESYQRSESIKARIATDESTLAEIDRQLLNPNLDENTRFNLNAQKSAINIRLSTARGMK